MFYRQSKYREGILNSENVEQIYRMGEKEGKFAHSIITICL